MEIYAAFQPFNEATRAFEPLIENFAAGLQPGDAILDPWCRSGWTALWLAELFPRQTIVACWEGDKSVLGYRGFGHWFASGKRPQNLEVVFAHPERGLPFADHVFSGVYGLDAFHRFTLTPFAGDILRVASPDAVIALAHLHLTNSEPDPYFDRGGFMWHGGDYRAWLDEVCHRQGRKARVFSENDLFSAGDEPPAENPQTGHYNGFVFIEPAARQPIPDGAPGEPADPRWLINPLFRVVLSRQAARVDATLHNGMAGELLERHPIYVQRLPRKPVAIGEQQLALIALAITGATASEIGAKLRLNPIAVEDLAAPLEAVELMRKTGAGLGAVELQRFHANQLPVTAGNGALATILSALAEQSEDVVRTPDGGMSGVEADFGLRSFGAYLRAQGLSAGDRLVLNECDHPLSLLLALAGLALQLEVDLTEKFDARIETSLEREENHNVLRIGRAGGAAETVLAWMATEAAPLALAVEAGGSLTIRVEGERVTFEANILAEAALSLESIVESHPAAITGFGDIGGLLTALTGLASSRCITFHV